MIAIAVCAFASHQGKEGERGMGKTEGLSRPERERERPGQDRKREELETKKEAAAAAVAVAREAHTRRER